MTTMALTTRSVTLAAVMRQKSKFVRAWPTDARHPLRWRVFQMQRQIYRSACRGDLPETHQRQRQLTHNISARLMAVKWVTTHREAGVRLTVGERFSLALQLNLDGSAKTVTTARRCSIKSAANHRGPSVLQTLKDQATQALVRLALEPQHGCYCNHNHATDGVACVTAGPYDAVRGALAYGETYALRTDFDDRHYHSLLLTGLQSYPELSVQIRAWLARSVMYGSLQHHGRPHGGRRRGLLANNEVLRPLFANITLQELVRRLRAKPNHETDQANGREKSSRYGYHDGLRLRLLNHANSCVAFHGQPHALPRRGEQNSQLQLDSGPDLAFLGPVMAWTPISQGFNYLGFTVQTLGRPCARVKTQSRPSKASVLRHGAGIRHVIQANKSTAAGSLVRKLRPRVVGWCSYFRVCECNATYHKLNFTVHQKLRAWMWRRDKRARSVVKESYMPSSKIYVYRGKLHRTHWTLVGSTVSRAGLNMISFLPRHTWVGGRKPYADAVMNSLAHTTS